MTVPVRRRPVAARQHPQPHNRHGRSSADAGATSAVDQRLNDLFGEVASLRDELHSGAGASAAAAAASASHHHRYSTPHHSDAFSPFRGDPATLRPPSAHLYSPMTGGGGGPPARLSAASTGRVPPPRVLEFTLTKSPRRSCGVGTGHEEIEPGDLLPPPDPAAQAAEAAAEAAAAAEKRVDARQETDEQEAERADCPERLKKLSGKEAEEEAAAAAEARRAAAAAVAAAAADAEMVRSADIDRTEEVQVRASGPGGKLDMTMREEDLVLLDPRRHTHLRHLTGWTLTHVNGTEVASHTEVRGLVTELTTLRFALVDPPLLEPSAASEKGDSCCAVM